MMSAAERFQIGECVGTGASSVVYRAFDRILNCEVVLKVLKPDQGPISRERFLNEALIGQSLNHPNIVRVHALVDNLVDGMPALIMESVRGESLQERLRRGGPITDIAELRSILRSIAEALAFAHRQGIVHRDVKPSNVLLGEDGSIKLADFGVAHAEGLCGLTATGDVFGSFGYIAPELLAGEPATVRSDVYSFGALARELLPKGGAATPLIRRAMQRVPELRFSSFDEVVEALEVRTFHFDRVRRWLRIVSAPVVVFAAALIGLTELSPEATLVTASTVHPLLARFGIDGIKVTERFGFAVGDTHALGRTAASAGDVEFLRFLHERRGARQVTPTEASAYYCAAAYSDQIEVVRYLSSVIPPENLACGRGDKRLPLLSRAIMQRNTELVELLALPSSADPELYKVAAMHPLVVATSVGHLPSFKRLLAHPEYSRLERVHERSVLYEVVRDRRVSELLLESYIASGAKLDAHDRLGRTALYVALMEVNLGAAARLIQLGFGPRPGAASLLTLFTPPEPR